MRVGDKIIDVSEHRTTINWPKVKKTDVKGVIIRCGYGRNNEDKYFSANVRGCQANGIPILGVYHFMYAINAEQARQNAENAIKLVKKAGLPSNITIWADVEYDTVENAAIQGVKLGKAEVDVFTRVFCETVKKAGYKTGIYLNNDYRLNYYYKNTLSNYDLWLADYTGGPDVPCLIQQTGYSVVSGVPGKVDTNVWIGSGAITPPDNEPERTYLKTGDTGAAVKAAQELLTYCGFKCGSADGIYGAKTEAAVRKAQDALGCISDGLYGANTAAALTEMEKYVKVYKSL